MPGTAAKVFAHTQDWSAVIVCLVATAEVFVLADATAEVTLAAAAVSSIVFADATAEVELAAGGVSSVSSVSEAVPEINCE